ncbi:rhamnosyltransferase WsaF family glycosyltransferase [Paenibacillus urinalis]|uniref:rhamnosyltransferase WsaF family glycosyltransferase n=1 Tax=Paenibacillus urinalis TaxID=521520 RepID=UPI0019603C9B
MRTAWFIPSPMEGSGGHRTIFQNINALAEEGYKCDIYIEDDNSYLNLKEMKSSITKYFGKVKANFFLGFNSTERYDAIFATAWHTAKVVRDIPYEAKKFYFVQDFEAYFNPMGDGYLLAENSYKYNLTPITIGRWLSNVMIKEFGTPSRYFDFCADHTVYKRNIDKTREKAICFIYQPEKPRRCSIIGIEALGIVKHFMPEVKIYLYGSKNKTNVWFEHTNLELISVEQCNDLYNSCSVGLCISSSNPSRIPFEMMASGLPVIDVYRENNLYDMPDGGVRLADPTPESIAKALMDVLSDEDQIKQMSDFGTEYMRDKTLEHGYRQFTDAVKQALSNEEFNYREYPKSYNNDPIIADAFMKKIQYSHVNSIPKSNITKFKDTLRKLKNKAKKIIK